MKKTICVFLVLAYLIANSAIAKAESPTELKQVYSVEKHVQVHHNYTHTLIGDSWQWHKEPKLPPPMRPILPKHCDYTRYMCIQ